MSVRGFRAGELVRVKTPREILATLDAEGAFEGVPFMPEMLDILRRDLSGPALRREDVRRRPSQATVSGRRRGDPRRPPLRWSRPRRMQAWLPHFLEAGVAGAFGRGRRSPPGSQGWSGGAESPSQGEV